MSLGKLTKKAARKVGRAAKKTGQAARKAGTVALDKTDTVLRAPGRVLHDVPVVGRVAGAIPGVKDPLAPIFASVVATNVVQARRLSVPSEYTDLVRRYIAANANDGAWLARGLKARPRFHTGGWILTLQPNAAAMTLDNDVFVKDGSLPVRLYVHELVHVGQYKVFGRTAFLTTYFGLSAATIASRLIRRKPLEPMKSSPHEKSAYAIDRRFAAWLSAQGG